MRAERALRPVDEANLVLDHPGQVNVFLVAGWLAPGGFVSADGTLDLDAARAAVRRRVAELPALRQVPVRAGRWHEWRDLEPDLDQHVRAVGPIDDLDALERRCGDLMSQPLPLSQPLWELLLAPSGRGGAALVLRIHHAIADGMAAAELIRRLFDTDAPSLVSDDPELAAAAGAVPSAAHAPGGSVMFGLRRIWATLTARGLPTSVLLGERSAHHGVIFADAELSAIASRARQSSATVNDAVLAIAASAYRSALAAAGDAIPAELTVSVPVALARTGDSRNQVGVMLVRLPLDEMSPFDRLARIAAQTRVEKVQARRQGTLELMRGPRGARIMDRVGHRQHLVAGFVTNVPGPKSPMSLAGAPLTQLWPVAVLAANVRLGVAVVSYAGRLCLGIHFDADFIDAGAVAAAVRREVAALAL